jgi:hypothetical protein
MPEQNSPQAPPTEFDANAPQTIFIKVEIDGVSFTVGHIFDPYNNLDRMVEYFKRLKSVLLPSEIKGGVASEDDTVTANSWLWEKLAVGMVGRGDSDDELPEDWKQEIENDERDYAINQLLGAQIIPVATVSAEGRLAWGRKVTHIAVPMLVRFGSYQVRVTHHLKKYSASQLTLYKRLASRREHVPGDTINKAETQLPSAARELYDLYLDMRESVEGYSGGLVPLSHALLALRHVFSTGMESEVKKLTATQPPSKGA